MVPHQDAHGPVVAAPHGSISLEQGDRECCKEDWLLLGWWCRHCGRTQESLEAAMHRKMMLDVHNARMQLPPTPSISSESSAETTDTALSDDPDPAESCSSSADSVAEGQLSGNSVAEGHLSQNSAAEGHLSDNSMQAECPSDEESLAAVFPNDDTSGSAKRMTRRMETVATPCGISSRRTVTQLATCPGRGS
jgi:hypothetical protein